MYGIVYSGIWNLSTVLKKNISWRPSTYFLFRLWPCHVFHGFILHLRIFGVKNTVKHNSIIKQKVPAGLFLVFWHHNYLVSSKWNTVNLWVILTLTSRWCFLNIEFEYLSEKITIFIIIKGHLKLLHYTYLLVLMNDHECYCEIKLKTEYKDIL